MTKLEEYCNTGQEDKSALEICKITWTGVAANLVLSVIKFILGTVGRSQALVADAVHSLSDLSTDFAILLGVKFWTKPPDEDHPYGHNRIELLVSIIIGMILLSAALGIGFTALLSLREQHIRPPGWIAFIGALLSILVKEILYRKTFAVGKRLKSSAVIANAWHHRTDALSSIPVAIAVAAAAINTKWAFTDHIGAFVVSLFIVHAAGRIIKKAVLDMIDTGVPEKQKEVIRSAAMAAEGVIDTHAIRTRSVGSGIFVDLHVLVDPELSVKAAHDIARAVKDNLIKKDTGIIDVIVHIEPA